MNNRELDDLVERLKQTACGGTHWNEMLLSASHAICVLRQESNQLCDQLAAARALLREANKWIGRDCTSVREQIAELAPLCNRIDAALAGEGKE